MTASNSSTNAYTVPSVSIATARTGASAKANELGMRGLHNPPPMGPSSAEALAQLATLPVGAVSALREYLHGDCLMLYTTMDASATVDLLSIRHHRQLSFDFARLWPGAGRLPSA